MPHPLALLLGCVVIASSLSYILPAGEYERRPDKTTGRNVVVPGTFHAVPNTPVGPFATLMAVPKGMTDAASVIFLVFLVGGAFSVIDATGAFRQGVQWLAHRLSNRTELIIPIVSIAFATGGAVEGCGKRSLRSSRSCSCSPGAWDSMR
jgi:uncharacterized ion transporter superfamily protein YfcC